MWLSPSVLVPLLLAILLVWLTLVLITIVGRLGHDLRRRTGTIPPRPGSRRERRLLRKASRHGHTEASKWRRIGALRELSRVNHPACRTLVPEALADADSEVVGAAVRSLGDIGTAWALEDLVRALRLELCPRSRVAAQLERLAPAAGPLLVPLLDDDEPAVRFWAATLLSRYPTLATPALVIRTRDADPNVRAAAVESLASRRDERGLAAALTLLDDPEWFVRVHAARTVGTLGGPEDAEHVAPLLADKRWWVRAAAKDALRMLGQHAARVLLPYLDHPDLFARNGAAEVLQDVGFVDMLVEQGADAAILERVFAAGGERMREAAQARKRPSARRVA